MEADDQNTCSAATDAGCDTGRPSIKVPLPGNAGEVFRQLFMNGPTWDGDIVSKSGRDELFRYGLATRVEGWSFLTTAGVVVALGNDLDRAKERRDVDRADAARRLSSGAL